MEIMFRAIAVLSTLVSLICIVHGHSSRVADIAENPETAVINEFNTAENEVVNEFDTVRDTTLELRNNITRVFKDACTCINYNCGCCAHLTEPEIHLNSTVCVNVTYLVHDYGISFTITVNDYTIYNETVSARNPPPICAGPPYVKDYAEICIRLYDVDATSTHLHACARIEAFMKMILIAKYDLGCFNVGPPRVATTESQYFRFRFRLGEGILSNTSLSIIGRVVIVLLMLVGIVFVQITTKGMRDALLNGGNHGHLRKIYVPREILTQGRSINC